MLPPGSPVFPGTSLDNMREYMTKSRLATKLNAQKARAIRSDPKVRRVIAANDGISVGHVSAINSEAVWLL